MTKKKQQQEVVSTRWDKNHGLVVSKSLARVFGNGAVIRPGIIELFGQESHGKSALAYHLCAKTQEQNGLVILVDYEQSFDPEWAQLFGIDTDAVVNIELVQEHNGQPVVMTAEEVYPTVFRLVAEFRKECRKEPILVVTDSYACIQTSRMADVGVSTMTMRDKSDLALWASNAIPHMNILAQYYSVIFLFINQVRDDLSYNPNPYINKLRTRAGRAFKHGASARVEVKRIETLKNGKERIGFRSRVTNVKNRVGGCEGDECTFVLKFGVGIEIEE